MDDLWNQALSVIKKKINKQSFDTWFLPTIQVAQKDSHISVGVPNTFFADWLQDHYLPIIKESLRGLSDREIQVEFIVNHKFPVPQTHSQDQPKPTEPKRAPINIYQRPVFNPKYTFDNFIVGASNQLAHAAALAVAEQPSKAYNPLFIYGGVGLGKTHLLHAVGHAILNLFPASNLCYTSSEEFMNELINAIRYDRTTIFRDKYRNMDVLLIDDIQFITGKERTQEEFFHTFNSLYEAHKQIIISSDRPPRDISTIEERLRSRFEWGLIADIQPPDLETKIAILRKKCDREKLNIPNDVLMLIASNIISNIRELEGSLNRIAAFSTIKGRVITVQLAQEVLKDILIEKERSITIEKIQQVTAQYFNMSPNDLKSKVRVSSIALPRQIAMYLCRTLTNNSLPVIGTSFGGKDHTTVLHAYKKIDKKVKEDITFKGKLDNITSLIRRS